MAPAVRSVALFTLVPVLATALGATFAVMRPPGPRLRSAIQHFAAGVVFSVVAVELLPDVVRVHDPFEVGWTFAAGVALMLGVQWLGKRLERRESEDVSDGHVGGGAKATAAGHGASLGQLVAVGIDVLINGLLVGIAFSAGAKEGLLLTGALTLELLSLGMAIAATLTAAGASAVRRVGVTTGISLLLVAGAVGGDTIFREASEHTLAGVLSFGCAALLYLVTEELLVEAHETRDTVFATTIFFVGFLVFLLLGMEG